MHVKMVENGDDIKRNRAQDLWRWRRGGADFHLGVEEVAFLMLEQLCRGSKDG